MADRYPLIINPSANQIQEIPSGDNLNLGACHIVDVAHINSTGVVTATKFVGPMEGTVTGNISGTSGGLSGTPNINVGNIDAATGNFTGNVSIGGTLTYEDVKNVDSVGLITARNGLAVTGGTATFSGSIDANQGIDVDGQTTLDNVNVSGVITATGAITSSGTVTAVRYYGSNADISGTLHTPTGVVTTLTVPGTGVLKVGTAVTIHAGVVTATSFVGDGSNLTGIAADKIFEGNTEAEVVDTGTDGHFKVTTEGTERFRIDSSGRVLVAGANNYHADADDFVLKERSGGNVGMTFQNTGTGYGVIYFGDSGAQHSGRIQYDHGNDSLDLYTAGSERVGITSTGKIGINKTSPSANGIELVGPGGGNGEILVSRTSGTSIQIQSQAALGRFGTTSNHALQIIAGGNGKIDITTGGAVLPVTDDAQDLGSSSKRWANVYTGDLHLSNSGSGNSVDGTSGSWTMQEGESDLFLINNKTGKKYKFNLTEVS